MTCIIVKKMVVALVPTNKTNDNDNFLSVILVLLRPDEMDDASFLGLHSGTTQ